MEFSAIPLAFFAGLVSVLSPCVLPMVPAVAASALRSSVMGLWMLALGLGLSFAFAGSLLTFIFLNAGIAPDILRTASAVFILLMGIVLLVKPFGDALSWLLSRMMSYLPAVNFQGEGLLFQFIVGASLGLVWLPCVGPTLGAAIALASQGQQMWMAFLVMLAFGLGTAMPLLAVGYLAGKSLLRWKKNGLLAKQMMGFALVLLALVILTGVDHWLEIWTLQFLPDWAVDI